MKISIEEALDYHSEGCFTYNILFHCCFWFNYWNRKLDGTCRIATDEGEMN